MILLHKLTFSALFIDTKEKKKKKQKKKKGEEGGEKEGEEDSGKKRDKTPNQRNDTSCVSLQPYTQLLRISTPRPL